MIYLLISIIIISLIVYKSKTRKNPYKEFHRLKIKNDNNYKEYLKWCYSVGEIPMDKYDYIKEILDKENEIKKLVE